jgi:hypothetical protein
MISRYLLLMLFNLPFIIAAVVSQITLYKLGKSTKKRLYVQLVIWVIILIGLASAERLYEWLHSGGFTQTESLSLFDVIQITAIVMLIYITNRSRQKIEVLETRLNHLHQELSIRLSLK